MSHLLRGKQAGVHSDLSAGLAADLFHLDHVRACRPPEQAAFRSVANTWRV